jgi:hypothetical protein
LLHLNKCQQFDVKHTVKFSTLAWSDNCESMVRLRSITTKHKRNLFFFGKLCKIDEGI